MFKQHLRPCLDLNLQIHNYGASTLPSEIFINTTLRNDFQQYFSSLPLFQPGFLIFQDRLASDHPG